jgi:tetratricopeptide (TPR) repeat protein
MKPHPEDPILRWRDRPPGGEAAEDRAAALIRGSLVPAEPDELHLARIERRSRRWSRSSLVPRLALTALFLVVGAATVMAARSAGWLDRILPALSPAPEPAPAYARRPRHPARVAAAAPAAVTDPTPPETNEIVAPAPGPAEAVPVAEIQPSPRKAHVSRRAASVDRPESPAPALSEEIRALDQSIGLLRRDRDPDAALSTLDAYLARYPHGVLNREARLARVDALLMLQRLDQAQSALETLPLDTHRRETELQVIRGELRARSDCARAEEDYSAVLARSSDAALVERALYGRGACRVKRGDGRGAAEDLRRYLERFPSGAHAAWARQWLESAGQSFMKGG